VLLDRSRPLNTVLVTCGKVSDGSVQERLGLWR